MASSDLEVVNGELEDLIKHCESWCVGGCCGLAAFDFSEEQVNSWCQDNEDETVKKVVNDLKDGLGGDLEDKVIERMNYNNAKKELQKIVPILEKHLKTHPKEEKK